MTDAQLIGIVIGAFVVALLLIAWLFAHRLARARREALREQFGPEYERTVEQLGTPSRADQELAQRARRVRHFRFEDLRPERRAHYAAAWEKVQARFVDDPTVAVTSANELINQVMRERGYPIEHFEQRVADLSVEHPNVVQHYRAAHELSRSVYNGTIDTEELRQAVIHYRALFAELLHAGLAFPAGRPRSRQAQHGAWRTS